MKARITLFFLMAGIAFSASGQYSVKEDRFTGDKTVTFKSNTAITPNSTVIPYERHFIAIRSKTADNAEMNSIFIIFKSRRWTYLRCAHMDWLVDGKPFKFNEVRTQFDTGTKSVTEGFILTADRAKLAQIASAKTVEMKVCNDEYVISSEAIAGTRQVVETSLDK